MEQPTDKSLSFKERLKKLKERIKKMKKPSKKNMFWAWITYQAVKGTMTTTFIWVPALVYWFHKIH